MKFSIIILIIIFILSGCSQNSVSSTQYPDEDITVAIYSSDSPNGTYFFNLNKDGTLIFKYGANTQYYEDAYHIKNYDFMRRA